MNVKRVSALQYLRERRSGITIDLRTAAEHAQECLPDCTLLPLQELNDITFETYVGDNRLNGTPVYLLCQSGRRAEAAIEKLSETDSVELVVIEGGLNALKQAGIETKKAGVNTVSLERQVRIVAGILVLLGLAMSVFVHPVLILISAFIGVGLVFAGVTDNCGMGILLARMPWNR